MVRACQANCTISIATEKSKRVVKKPKRFAEELSRLITVKKTEARKRDKKLYNVEVTEVGKVNKRIKIHFVGSIARNLTSGDFLGGHEGPDHKHLLSNAISRTEFVSNIGKLHTKLKELSRSFQFWWYFFN